MIAATFTAHDHGEARIPKLLFGVVANTSFEPLLSMFSACPTVRSPSTDVEERLAQQDGAHVDHADDRKPRLAIRSRALMSKEHIADNYWAEVATTLEWAQTYPLVFRTYLKMPRIS